MLLRVSFRCPPSGVHLHTWGGGTWTFLVVSHVGGTHSAKPQAHAAVCCQALTLNYSLLAGSGQYSEESVSVLPMETVSSADVTRSSSSMKCKAHATDWLSSNETSVTGDPINCRPRDRRVPAAPVCKNQGLSQKPTACLGRVGSLLVWPVSPGQTPGRHHMSLGCKAHATDWLSSNETSVTGDPISCRPRDRRVPAAPVCKNQGLSQKPTACLGRVGSLLVWPVSPGQTPGRHHMSLGSFPH